MADNKSEQNTALHGNGDGGNTAVLQVKFAGLKWPVAG